MSGPTWMLESRFSSSLRSSGVRPCGRSFTTSSPDGEEESTPQRGGSILPVRLRRSRNRLHRTLDNLELLSSSREGLRTHHVVVHNDRGGLSHGWAVAQSV